MPIAAGTANAVRCSTSEGAGNKIVASLLLPERRHSSEPVIPLPVADLGPVVDRGSVAFSLVRVGMNGVVAARVPLERLNWAPGLPLRLSVSSGLLVVAPSEKPSAALVPSKMSLTLPARLRARCRIRAEDQVLLAAVLEHDLLVVYPQHVLYTMVTAFHDNLVVIPEGTAHSD
ncbi:hypothetical protein [Amycolatopsis sp. cg9]|jgi:hypothetical protein|uniref:hypothetical protein n=1 Tax=Amycolatopsis sp. cg9 TaxID=3238801 RepID=UPI003524DCED